MAKVKNRKIYPDDAIPVGGKFGGIRRHRGLDHSYYHIARLGLSTAIKPWAEGVVTGVHASKDGLYGKWVEVKDGEGYFWSYCHLASISVKVGDEVSFTTTIGVMGNTGTGTLARHLHSMLSLLSGAARVNGIAVLDPLTHVNARVNIDPAGGGGVPIDPVDAQGDRRKRTTWLG